MSERWASVIGYEGIYSVSSIGRIRRDASGQGAIAGRILTAKGGSNRKYRSIELSKGDKKTRFLIHRLVAMAFLGSPPTPDSEVNHKNFDGSDNRVENLEWCSRQENISHATRHGRCGGRPMRGEENGRAVLSEADVVAILRLKGVMGQRQISEQYGVARSLIQRIHQRKAWSHVNPAEWPEDLRVRQFPEVDR